MRKSHLSLLVLFSGTAWAVTPEPPSTLCIDNDCPVEGNLLLQETHDAAPVGKRGDETIEGIWRTKIDGDSSHAFAEIADKDPLVGTSRYMKSTLIKNGTGNFRTERQMDTNLLPEMQSAGSIPSPFGQGSEDHWHSTQDYWYGFRLRIDQVSDDIEGYYIQWHDNPGGDSRSPPVAIAGSNAGLRLRLEKNYDAGNKDWFSPYFVKPPFIGVAHDIMLRIRWDTRSNTQGGSGAIDVYLDDQVTPVVSWRGQTAHPGASTDGRPPYVKWGLYKSNYKYRGTEGATNVQVHDHLKIMGGDGSLSGVKPPLPRN
jgi:hypothetical protein